MSFFAWVLSGLYICNMNLKLTKNMKKLLLVVIVVAVAVFATKSACQKEKLNDVVLENVEALADQEWEDGKFHVCIGSGKVDCYNGDKVERQYSFMSIGNEYETE